MGLLIFVNFEYTGWSIGRDVTRLRSFDDNIT
jgi:hypothetical protein